MWSALSDPGSKVHLIHESFYQQVPWVCNQVTTWAVLEFGQQRFSLYQFVWMKRWSRSAAGKRLFCNQSPVYRKDLTGRKMEHLTAFENPFAINVYSAKSFSYLNDSIYSGMTFSSLLVHWRADDCYSDWTITEKNGFPRNVPLILASYRSLLS